MRSRHLFLAAAAIAMLSFAPAAQAQVSLRNLTLKANLNNYYLPGDWGYSACWGYVHPDGREYAVLGTRNGTAIYNVTDPDNVHFVALIPGLASLWREMKQYRTWIYVTTENATPAGSIVPGLQIIRMTDPESPVLVTTYATNFNRSHTVSVDTSRAILICNGTNYRDPAPPNTTTARGMRILSLANPEAPVEVGVYPAAGPYSATNYVHDCVPFGNRLYVSSIYTGTQRILDFTNPASPVDIKSWTYPAAYYCHSAWPNASFSNLYVCDEQNGQTLRVFDISNETAPVLTSEWTSNPQAIIHNPRVLGTNLWLANYSEGIRVLDISDPNHPAEWGYADSYPGYSGGYNGVWDVYPYFPSGTIIASDMNTGLYVYTANPNYGVVYAHVTEDGSPLAGARVHVVASGDSALSGADGVSAFAPTPGNYTITATKFGYTDASVSIQLDPGEHLNANLPMTLKPTMTYSGRVVSASTGLPLEGAEVNLRWTPVHEHTDANGDFDLGQVAIGVYRLEVERPGYVPISFDASLAAWTPPDTFRLAPAVYYDPLTTDMGWQVGGIGTADNAVSGVWTRVEPFGTSIGAGEPVAEARTDGAGAEAFGAGGGFGGRRAGPLHGDHEGEGANPGQVQPEYDRSPAPDSLCWVTGQGTSHAAIEEADVDGPGNVPGHTTLTSPAYNTTGLAQPTLSVWVWFYSEFGSADDGFAVLISNDGGASWTAVDTLRGIHNHWQQMKIPVASYVTPTAQVRLRFVATDGGQPSVVECAVDDVSLYDGVLENVGIPGHYRPARLALRSPYPNPSRDAVLLAVELPRGGTLDADVVDLAGRHVATLSRGTVATGTLVLRWTGADDRGHRAPPGLYFVRARFGDEVARARVVRIR